MSSATTFPIELKGTNLQFGNANVPLAKAKSFWVYNQQPPQINVYCHKDNYQTTFRLFTENAQNMNECVSQFMKNTEMRADLFSVWDVTPFVGKPVDEKGNASEKSDASVEITFVQEVDRDYFEKYAPHLFPVLL